MRRLVRSMSNRAPGRSNAARGVEAPGRAVLRTRGPGWVLDVDPADVDALRFPRADGARGEGMAAAADLTEALGLWQGAALVDGVQLRYV
jgi:hypothetical protein